MKNKKSKKKAITIRIDQDILEQYEQTLTTIYGEKQRKKSSTIESLLKQFNDQDINKLIQYINQDKNLINLTDETIQDNQAENQKLLDEIQTLKDIIQKQQIEIQNNKQDIADKNKSIESFNSYLDKLIAEKDKIIADKDKTIEKLEIQLNNKEKEVIKQSNKKDEVQAHFNTLQTQYNDIEQENKKLNSLFKDINHLSLYQRIFKKYPHDIKELQDPKKQ